MKLKFFFWLMFSLSIGSSLSVRGEEVTNGWTQDKLHFEIQSPYDRPHSDRYIYDSKTDIHRLWVFRSDKPDTKSSTRPPRTEMSFDHYTSGRHQFEADVLVVTNTSAVSIFQIFGGDERHEDSPQHATSLQLRVYDGKLKWYDKNVLLSDMYGKWFHLNITHDTGTHEIQIFIDGQLVMTGKDNGGREWHMKCGVYAQKEAKGKMDVGYRHIRLSHQ